MKIIRTDSSNTDFRTLCFHLDNDLNRRYGKAQSRYDPHNTVEDNQTVVVGYFENTPVAGGCFKEIDGDSIEIKRMYVIPEHRRKGFSSRILSALESWAKELGYAYARLETGKGQPEAIGLYQKAGYSVTKNFGPYAGIDNSVCMKKKIPDAVVK